MAPAGRASGRLPAVGRKNANEYRQLQRETRRRSSLVLPSSQSCSPKHRTCVCVCLCVRVLCRQEHPVPKRPPPTSFNSTTIKQDRFGFHCFPCLPPSLHYYPFLSPQNKAPLVIGVRHGTHQQRHEVKRNDRAGGAHTC